MTFDQWYSELKELACNAGYDWLISSDQSSYRDSYDFGSDPMEELDDQIDEAKRSC